MVPCLDEEATVAQIVEETQAALHTLGLKGEVIIADNGCRDDSIPRARAAGARIVDAQDRAGPGHAVARGIEAAVSDRVVMFDADGEHDPHEIGGLWSALSNAPDALILGARSYDHGAGSWLNRSLGTPALTAALNLRFGLSLSDCNSGFRALARSTWDLLDMQRPGFEFCSEMLVQAARRNIKILEVPVRQRPPPPGRQSKLRRVRDGLLHLSVILGR